MARKINIGGRRVTVVQLVAAIAAVVGIVGVIGGFVYLQRASTISKALDWTPPGPPCPTRTLASLEAIGIRASLVSVYDEVSFARGYGYVTCNEIVADGGRGVGVDPVCQFNNPSVVRVTTKRGDYVFFPGGRPATVEIVKDVPRCEMAANQKLQ